MANERKRENNTDERLGNKQYGELAKIGDGKIF